MQNLQNAIQDYLNKHNITIDIQINKLKLLTQIERENYLKSLEFKHFQKLNQMIQEFNHQQEQKNKIYRNTLKDSSSQQMSQEQEDENKHSKISNNVFKGKNKYRKNLEGKKRIKTEHILSQQQTYQYVKRTPLIQYVPIGNKLLSKEQCNIFQLVKQIMKKVPCPFVIEKVRNEKQKVKQTTKLITIQQLPKGKDIIYIKNIPFFYNKKQAIKKYLQNLSQIKDIHTYNHLKIAKITCQSQKDVMKLANIFNVFGKQQIFFTIDPTSNFNQIIKQKQKQKTNQKKKIEQKKICQNLKSIISQKLAIQFKTLLQLKAKLGQLDQIKYGMEKIRKAKIQINKLNDQESFKKFENDIGNDWDLTLQIVYSNQSLKNINKKLQIFGTYDIIRVNPIQKCILIRYDSVESTKKVLSQFKQLIKLLSQNIKTFLEKYQQ